MRFPYNALVVIALSWALTLPAAAETWKVKQAGGGDFTTITSAIVSASNGDTIEVSPGVYLEQLELTGQNAKIVKLIAVEGPSETRIEGFDTLLTVGPSPAAGTLVEGFTFRDAEGGAIRLSGATITIRGNVFENNGTTEEPLEGGAIWAAASLQVVLEDNLFVGNQAEEGGAVYASGSSVTSTGNTFRDNSATLGGVFQLEDSAALSVDRTFACGNSASEEGGVIHSDGSSVDVHSGVFYDNTAPIGAAISMHASSGAETAAAIVGNLNLIDNNVTAPGGAIAVSAGALEVVNALIQQEGDAPFSLEDASQFTMDYSAFIGDGTTLAVTTGGESVELDLSDDNISAASASDLMVHGSLDDDPCAPGSFEPQVGSPLINKGDPSLKDTNGSRSDIGAYGGPEGIDPVRDTDDDGHADLADNCPEDKNIDQADFDEDDIGDICDPDPGDMSDPDNDGVDIPYDNCPQYNPDQADFDNDGQGDICDANDDNDPVPDQADCEIFNPDVYLGNDETCNGIDDNCDGQIDEGLNCTGEPEANPYRGPNDSEPEPSADSTPDAGGTCADCDETTGGDGGCNAAPSSPQGPLGLLLLAALLFFFTPGRSAGWRSSR